MNIVILSGSPRKGGNTELLAESFAQGASSKHNVDFISVRDYHINPCIGCSPVIDKAWNDWWMNYINHSGIDSEAKAKWLERKKLDRENSVGTSLKMLQEAGFEQTECVYQFMKFATIVAIK